MKSTAAKKSSPRRTLRVKTTTLALSPVPADARAAFPIVGIGASAGGLEALVQFLEQVPAASGMAYVVVQHLDPTRKGMMPELLQRATTMKVAQVKDRMRVRPNCVYVIPPNSEMSILHGVLHLLAPVAARGLRLPIDVFLRSLAEDQHELSAGVILSGMGSDGTLGLKAIKEKAGVALVQDPASAKFDAMPRSAIEAGLADFVAPAGELPGKLVAYRKHLPARTRSEEPLENKVEGALEKIVILLRAHTGHDFALYRRSTLYRRVERRMGIHQVARIATYVRYLQENPQELGILFKELLIGVTSFFRDPEAWERLAREALPALIAGRPAGGTLRAWVAGCSSGEEAYTLAMVFTETLRELKSTDNLSLQIYATDLDKDAIDKARQGFFPASIATEVSPARLKRFFVREPGGYRVNKEIRSMVVFAPQNLIMDPPFTKLDILSCRNLLIYLTPELQRKLFPMFHYSLNSRGVLFLGSAESIGGFSHLFTPLSPKDRLFHRNDLGANATLLDFPAVFVPAPSIRTEAEPSRRPAPSLQSHADQLLQSRFAPPAVIVNDKGDILYISGRTGRYLEPAAGKANWNVLAMAREGLQPDLTLALAKAVRKQQAIRVLSVHPGPDPGARPVDLLVEPLSEPKDLTGMVLIVFSDSVVAPAPGRPAARGGRNPHLTELQRDLRLAREELQAGREEMQTSQEELRSMNEELQSTNEELQSTNEELMTSKEEMQSLNEELQTVNAELQSKLDELSGANNDMKNLLNSTDIATVFLDRELLVRRFTLQAKSLINFIPSDVGRPISDLASELLYPELAADSRQAMQSLTAVERSITARDGRWFAVRVMPYRTMDNLIDGVVLTFTDTTVAKKLEGSLRLKHAKLTERSVRQDQALAIALGQSPPRTPLARPVRKSRP